MNFPEKKKGFGRNGEKNKITMWRVNKRMKRASLQLLSRIPRDLLVSCFQFLELADLESISFLNHKYHDEAHDHLKRSQELLVRDATHPSIHLLRRTRSLCTLTIMSDFFTSTPQAALQTLLTTVIRSNEATLKRLFVTDMSMLTPLSLLILSHCPNLRYLNACFPASKTYSAPMIVKPLQRVLSQCYQLEEVELDTRFCPGGLCLLNPADLRSLFRVPLPNLRILHLQNIAADRLWLRNWSSQLETLDLSVETPFSVRGLENLTDEISKLTALQDLFIVPGFLRSTAVPHHLLGENTNQDVAVWTLPHAHTVTIRFDDLPANNSGFRVRVLSPKLQDLTLQLSHTDDLIETCCTSPLIRRLNIGHLQGGGENLVAIARLCPNMTSFTCRSPPLPAAGIVGMCKEWKCLTALEIYVYATTHPSLILDILQTCPLLSILSVSVYPVVPIIAEEAKPPSPAGHVIHDALRILRLGTSDDALLSVVTAPKLTGLMFRGGFAHCSHLEEFVHRCPALRWLELHQTPNVKFHSRFSCPSLRDLSLYPVQAHEQYPISFLLQSFPRLQSLTCGLFLQFGLTEIAAVSPPELHTLVIQTFSPGFSANDLVLQLDDLFHECPALKSITLPKLFNAHSVSLAEDLARLFGVSLQFLTAL